MDRASIASSVKDTALIKKRRNQIIKAAITLFKQKGFHKTTTREIAKASGFSIGTLYEYIRSKEDVLFLVYESINDAVYKHLKQIIKREESSNYQLIHIIDAYFRLMDNMQEEVIILYQEMKSLQEEVKGVVLEKEREMVNLLKKALMTSMPYSLTNKEAELMANNIFVQGHMWCFRRWTLHKNFTLEEYIDMQSNIFIQMTKVKRV